MKKIGILLCFSAFCGACKDDTAARQARIQEEVQILVDNYRKVRLAECYQTALDSADHLVDSLILAEAQRIDTAALQARPQKPPKVVLKSVLDTLPVQPILR